ncbi:MAG: cytochrome c oxidase subunit II [Kofleriaceae bacterium]
MKTLSSSLCSARSIAGTPPSASSRRSAARVLSLVAVLLTGGLAFAQPAAPSAPEPAAAAPAADAVGADGAAPAADAAATPAEGATAVAPAPAPAPPAGKAWYDLEAAKPHNTEGTYWLPKPVNRVASDSDMMFYSVLAMSFFFFFAITIAVIYFVVRYRHRPGRKPEPSAAHNDALEITWTVIPTIICVFLFWFGWRAYVHVATPPLKAVEVQVLAYRWGWNFTHSNGVQDADLHVPVNTPVRLVMTAKDVLHSFFVPVLRTKQDLVPRRYTYMWFEATKPGTYRLYCTEYCGRDHSQMKVKFVVHTPGGYERYLADKAALSSNMPPLELGKMLYEKKGCNACHSLDGSPRVGPSFKGTFGGDVPLSDGSSIKMDENYIRTSILNPLSQSRPGFPPSMPSFEGQLKDKEIEGLIEFIKSLK